MEVQLMESILWGSTKALGWCCRDYVTGVTGSDSPARRISLPDLPDRPEPGWNGSLW